MQKPFSELTQAELDVLMKHLEALAASEKDFPGVLGNKNSFFIAKPLPRRRKAAKKATVAA